MSCACRCALGRQLTVPQTLTFCMGQARLEQMEDRVRQKRQPVEHERPRHRSAFVAVAAGARNNGGGVAAAKLTNSSEGAQGGEAFRVNGYDQSEEGAGRKATGHTGAEAGATAAAVRLARDSFKRPQQQHVSNSSKNLRASKHELLEVLSRRPRAKTLSPEGGVEHY